MKFRKKLTLVIVLLLSLSFVLNGCGKKNQETSGDQTKGQTEAGEKTGDSSKTTETAEKPFQLTMVFPTFGTTPVDMKLVQDEINKIALEKVNVEVTLMPISIGFWNDQTNLMLSSSEKVDLMSLFSGQFTTFAAKGQLLSINDLVAEYGQGIVEQVGEDYLKAGQINGEQYAVTTNRDLAQSVGLVMKKEIVDKYKIDVNTIKTLDDLEKVLKTVKENEPDLVPLVPGAIGMGIVQMNYTYDALGDSFGVLANYGEELKVENYVETQEYADLLAKVRGWYQAGYILEDATTTQEAGPAMVKAGRAFAYISVGKPGYAEQESRMAGTEMVAVDLIPAKTSTAVVQTVQWTLPLNCENPEKTMQFLNLMYTDANIANLLSWGIEGKHYVVTDGNVIDYPEGVNASNTGFGLNMGWLFGNQFITYIWKGDDPELWTKMKEFNESAIKSKAIGFTYDSTSVKNEVTACTNVVSQYKLGLECGVVDPAEVLPEFIKALKDAGIDKIIAEKQAQLDAWASKQ